METTKIDIEALAARFVECMPPLDAAVQRISIALYRLLAEGEPVRSSENPNACARLMNRSRAADSRS